MGKEKAQKREKAAYPPIEYHHEESRHGRNKKRIAGRGNPLWGV